jgi:iron complex transport system ATP-binding protein
LSSLEARPHAIEARGLVVRLGEREVLRGVDLAVGEGELVTVIGPNGSGKTTLIRALDGLVAPAAGEVLLMGRPLARMDRRELARTIAYVPQGTDRAADFTVRESVVLGRYPYLRGWASLSPDDLAAVDDALSLTEMTELEDRPLGALSGGEYQRTLIAAALAQGGRVMLLDEPTSFLDTRHCVQVLELLTRLHREHGLTVVAVTHDLNGLVAVSDRVMALGQGHVVFDGLPTDLLVPDTLEGIFGTGFRCVPGGRHGLPLAVPAWEEG